RFGILIKTRTMYQRIVPISGEPVVRACADPHALPGCGAMCSGVEDLRARHRDLYRSAQHPGTDRCERRIDIIRQLVPEPATDETRDDAHILLRNAEGSREALLRARGQLRR